MVPYLYLPYLDYQLRNVFLANSWRAKNKIDFSWFCFSIMNNQDYKTWIAPLDFKILRFSSLEIGHFWPKFYFLSLFRKLFRSFGQSRSWYFRKEVWLYHWLDSKFLPVNFDFGVVEI